MRWKRASMAIVPAVIVGGVMFMAFSVDQQDSVALHPLQAGTVALPAPARAGEVSFEEALDSRQSVRMFSPDPLTLTETLPAPLGGPGPDTAGGLSHSDETAGRRGIEKGLP